MIAGANSAVKVYYVIQLQPDCSTL